MPRIDSSAARAWVQSGTPARIDEILTKARDVLVRDGYADFNLRKVASEVGVRLATIQHHFATREALLTAAITKALEDWGRAFLQITTNSARDPERRLRELHALNFDLFEDPSTAPLVVECFALAQHDAAIRDVVLFQYFRYRRLVADLLREIRPNLSTDTLMAFATVFTAQLEGLVMLLRRDDPHRPDDALMRRALDCQVDAFFAAFRAYGSRRRSVRSSNPFRAKSARRVGA
jgi:AcrR family transcriptional regulator